MACPRASGWMVVPAVSTSMFCSTVTVFELLSLLPGVIRSSVVITLARSTAKIGALLGAVVTAVWAAYRWTKLSHTLLFWAAFVLTRPLGAVVGDFLDKPHAQGGLDLSRFGASGALLLFILICIAVFPQRAARSTH